MTHLTQSQGTATATGHVTPAPRPSVDAPLTPMRSLPLTRRWLRAGRHTISWAGGMWRFLTPCASLGTGWACSHPLGAVSQCSCLIVLSSGSLDLTSAWLCHQLSGFYTHTAVLPGKLPLPGHDTQRTPYHPCCLPRTVPHSHSIQWTRSYLCSSCWYHGPRAEYGRKPALVVGSASLVLLLTTCP